jgi:hypothetical protein
MFWFEHRFASTWKGLASSPKISAKPQSLPLATREAFGLQWSERLSSTTWKTEKSVTR